MSTENEHNNQVEHKLPAETEKKIHQTHFPVVKIPLCDGNNDSEHEWVSSGNGRWILVRKKAI